jgi:hypothetical protein
MDMWTIGFTDRLRFPRFPSKLGSGEMLAFAHIPTGTTTSKGIGIDNWKRKAVTPATALTAIGADIEIDRTTP